MHGVPAGVNSPVERAYLPGNSASAMIKGAMPKFAPIG